MSTIHLQPIMKEIPSYVKDTSDFINKISNHNIPKESKYATLDVKSLHTSIPNPEEIAVVKKTREGYNTKQFQQRSQLLFSTYFDLKQLHIQFKILLTNKTVCNGYYLCSNLCKYLYGLLRREIHSPIN